MKAAHKLTELRLARAKVKSRQYEMAEQSGLRLRIYPSGKKAFVYRYRDPAGVQRVVTLGAYPALTLGDARLKLETLKRDAERGEDPADKVRQQREAKRLKFVERAGAPTVDDVLNEYLHRHIEPNTREATRTEFKRLVDKELAPRLGSRKAAELTRTAVVAALDDIADKRTAQIADHAAQVLRAAFRFAVRRGRLEHNPCLELPRYAERKARERVLSTDEIKALWKTLKTPDGVSKPVALALKLLLVTGQRRGSLMAARWEHVSGDRWEIPAEHFKGKRSHTVPLSKLARGLCDELRAITGKTDYLFPSPSLSRPMTAKAPTRALYRLNCEFTVHDLRRTAATLMAEAGVSRFTIARVLGHSDNTVTAVYDRHGYLDEMRKALDKLAQRLEIIVEKPRTAKVVALRA
jgi:integrase